MLLGSAGAAIGGLAGCSQPTAAGPGRHSDVERTDRRYAVSGGDQPIADAECDDTASDDPAVGVRAAQAQGGGRHRR